jgi:hypothetical protein
MSLSEVKDYFRRYDKNTFRVVACKGHEPWEADLAAFELTCGFRLPDEFRYFTMSPLGGLYMEVKEELWPRPKAGAAGPLWSFLYAVKVFGIAVDIPDWLDIRKQYLEMRKHGFNLVPFLQREGDADRCCFNASGQIVRWDHEEPDAQELVPFSFSELLMKEIRDLEDRARKKLAGEDRRQC